MSSGPQALKIMTLNCGSSSAKYSLWESGRHEKRRLCEGIVERVGLEGSFIRHRPREAPEVVLHRDCPDHDSAFELIVETVLHPDYGVIEDLSDTQAVGHRVVHGGERFTMSAPIDEEVLETVEECSRLAPLHNPPNLRGIAAARQHMPHIPHIAVFDTAFFTTMPPESYLYALPYEWYQKYGIRRYGFHGTSHLYVSRRAAALLGKAPAEANLITLHIGNGVSVTAIKKGAAYDHSMGFTPLEGAAMGTRCGDIDPAIPLYVMEMEGTSPSEMSDILNKRSGLLGISGTYVDRRDLLAAAERGEERARLAVEIECHRLRKYIGAYAAALGHLDAVVFTAGVGENSPTYRSKICSGLGILGISIDEEANTQAVGRDGEATISSPEAEVKVLVIPTQEELVIVEDVLAILENRYRHYTRFSYSFEEPGFSLTETA